MLFIHAKSNIRNAILDETHVSSKCKQHDRQGVKNFYLKFFEIVLLVCE